MESLGPFLPFQKMLPLLMILAVLGFSSAIAHQKVKSDLETYIVHVSKPLNADSAESALDIDGWYSSFLPETAAGFQGEAQPQIGHSYQHVLSGFAARLTPEHVKEMEKKEGFVSARRVKRFSLHTTHTPNFLGLHQNLGFWQASNYGQGMIIGLLDTGVTPHHPSFKDEGMPPPPRKWKGKCDPGAFCNNKLIGARSFIGKGGPPTDVEGHGTHTSSTAAGSFVANASVFGQASGTAAGMAPRAHVAMYQVCSDFGCDEDAILAGLDAAIEDGVDILSLSLGGNSSPFHEDSIATGAFAAMQNGILVSTSAGNDGPLEATMSNEAPWLLTVAASTLDRSFRATAVLGNKEEFDGQSIFQPANFPPSLPLIYPGLNNETLSFCEPESLDGRTDIKGKIVVCVKGGDVARIDKGRTVKEAGGAGMILINPESDGYSTIADAHVLPATHVSYDAGQRILAYMKSTATPTATIAFHGTVIGLKDAPAISSFSSRGPNQASPGILKPDITGPGLSIFAAWPFSMDNNTQDRSKTFNVISGTSMSCPHLSGIAALIKSSHPDWSPAAIKSAMMTTADSLNLNNQHIMDERLLPANLFALGSGQVNPSKANDPGLVYDIHPDDYIPYLCGLNYTDREIRQIVQRHVQCSSIKSISEAQLNYPSFSVKLESQSDSKVYTRTVTNVGPANSTYIPFILYDSRIVVKVNPDKLVFTGTNQQQTYQVSFSRSPSSPPTGGGSVYVEGALTWISGSHRVRSPISVYLVE